MKTRKNTTLATAMIVSVILGLSSCKKEQPVLQSKSKSGFAGINDTYNMMLRATLSLGNSGAFKTEDADAVPGAIITVDSLSMPHTRTIDYGSGCMDNDGKVHKGKVIISYTSNDFLHENGGYVTVAPDNYSVDDNQISGTSTLQNNGINGNGNVGYTYSIDAKRVWANNGGTDSMGGQQAVEWVAGSSTSDKTDDEFSFTGAVSGTTHDGDLSFTISILQPLIKKRIPGCGKFYLKGELLTQITGESDEYLDYGDGTCDNLAVRTVDGVSTTITLEE